MRLRTLSTIWVTTPLKTNKYGEMSGGYTDLKKFEKINIQTDINQLDIAEFGEKVNEIKKCRSLYAPDIKVGDMIYMEQPKHIDDFEHNGKTYKNYGKGDYEVKSVKHSYENMKLYRNPTLITIQKVTQ